MRTFPFMEHHFAGNPVDNWLLAVAIWCILFVVLLIVKKLLVRYLGKLAEKTDTKLDDLLVLCTLAIRPFYVFIVSFYLSSFALDFKPSIEALLYKTFLFFTFIQFGIFGNVGIRFWVDNYIRIKAKDNAEIQTSVGLITFSLRMALYLILILLVLNNLGVDITALVAGLGVGGIAIALALQSILGDLFASLTIVLDKPFLVGDVISVGDVIGEVEHIGLKTTRIKSITGEQVIFSNADMLKNRIRNYKRMKERRVVNLISVIYDTTPEKLTQIPHLIREAVSKQRQARFDRAHFKEYAESGLLFEIVYYIESPDYLIYMDVQQGINLSIFEIFAQEKISFAFPTRTVYLKKDS